MDISNALNSRFTCRAFKHDSVSRDVLNKIFEDANRSPSWANTQPWEIYVASGTVLKRIRNGYLENFKGEIPPEPDVDLVKNWPETHEKRIKELGAELFKHLKITKTDEEARKASWKRNFQFFGALTVVYLCMDQKLGEWSMFDLGSLSQSIMLAANGIGVNSAIAINLVAYPNILRRELNIPEELSIVIGIALGYQDDGSPENSFRSPRRPLDEVVKYCGL